MTLVVRRCSRQDEDAVMGLLVTEGDEWSCCWAPEVAQRYRAALRASTTYVAVWDGEVCGYWRSIDDDGFYVYVCDLLVTGRSRDRDVGRSMLERVRQDHPAQLVYVMSDADGCYEKLGYHREGSVFEVGRIGTSGADVGRSTAPRSVAGAGTDHEDDGAADVENLRGCVPPPAQPVSLDDMDDAVASGAAETMDPAG